MDRTEIIGNLTKDPELRVTQTGINVCTFTVAVNQRLTKAQRDAGQQPQAKYYRVTAWRELADICSKYLAKGRKVYVDGTISASAYTSQDGSIRASLELTAKDVEFLSGKNDSDGSSTAAPVAQASTQAPADNPTAGFTPTTVEDEELPF